MIQKLSIIISLIGFMLLTGCESLHKKLGSFPFPYSAIKQVADSDGGNPRYVCDAISTSPEELCNSKISEVCNKDGKKPHWINSRYETGNEVYLYYYCFSDKEQADYDDQEKAKQAAFELQQENDRMTKFFADLEQRRVEREAAEAEEQRARQQVIDAKKKQIAEDKSLCKDLGFKLNTEGMANCLLTQLQRHDAENERQQAAYEAETARQKAAELEQERMRHENELAQQQMEQQAEIARQQRAAMYLQGLQAQQAENMRQQQQRQQQQMEMYKPPTTTNCDSNGYGGVRCTTR